MDVTKTLGRRLTLLVGLVACAVAVGVATPSAKAQLCGSGTCLGGGVPPYPCTSANEGQIVSYQGYYYICTWSTWQLYRG